MKQTAVEWLEDCLTEQHPNGSFVWNTRADLEALFKQAKEMEKKQMQSASCPYIGGWEEGEFEYWYNETFKK